jgi:hypothetical protein
VVFGLLFFIITQGNVFFSFVLALVGWTIPEAILNVKIKKRVKKIK